MSITIKYLSFNIVIYGDKSEDLNQVHLSFGDKIIVLGPGKKITRTYFLGTSVSGLTLSALSPTGAYVINVSRDHVIKNDWPDSTNNYLLYQQSKVREVAKLIQNKG